MKKAKKEKPKIKKRKTKDEEIYQKIKHYQDEPIAGNDIEEEPPSVSAEDSEAEDEVKEDDF